MSYTSKSAQLLRQYSKDWDIVWTPEKGWVGRVEERIWAIYYKGESIVDVKKCASYEDALKWMNEEFDLLGWHNNMIGGEFDPIDYGVDTPSYSELVMTCWFTPEEMKEFHGYS